LNPSPCWFVGRGGNGRCPVDLRFACAERDRSCPRTTSGFRCCADPGRTEGTGCIQLDASTFLAREVEASLPSLAPFHACRSSSQQDRRVRPILCDHRLVAKSAEGSRQRGWGDSNSTAAVCCVQGHRAVGAAACSFHRTSGDRSCPLLSAVDPSGADPARTEREDPSDVPAGRWVSLRSATCWPGACQQKVRCPR
jgi:hypothetical protein